MSGRLFVVVLLRALLGVVPLAAQAPASYLARGIASYEALEYDVAAGWFHRALTPPLVEGLSPPELTRGLAYLGATERFRGRVDSAASAFRRMLRVDPRARPDPLVFPPEVTRLFEQVRAGLRIARIGVADEWTIDHDHRAYPVALAASTPHQLTLTLDGPDGRPLDTLYAGPIGDTLSLTWDGSVGAGEPAPSGRFWITATSVAEGPRACRVRRPVEITARAPDTLPLPPAPDPARFLPERAGTDEAPAAFGKAVFFATIALGLPLIAKDAKAGQSRIVAGALGAGGVIALIRYRPGQALPENVAANATVRARWKRQTDRVAAENAERRRYGTLRIRAGSSFTIGCDAP